MGFCRNSISRFVFCPGKPWQICRPFSKNLNKHKNGFCIFNVFPMESLTDFCFCQIFSKVQKTNCFLSVFLNKHKFRKPEQNTEWAFSLIFAESLEHRRCSVAFSYVSESVFVQQMLKRQTVFLSFFDLLNKFRKWQNAKWCRMRDFQVPGCESITGWQDYQMLCRTTRVARATQWLPIPRYVPPRKNNWTIDGGGLTAISPPQGRGSLPAGSLPTNRNHFQSIIIIFCQC